MDIIFYLCLGFLVTTYNADCSSLSPANLWPLTNISFAWDVILERDATYPTKDQCPISLESGPPNFNFLAFVFDRSHDSYVKVTTANSGEDGFRAVTLTFMLYLESLTSGLILEYSASNVDDGLVSTIPSSDFVKGLVLELHAGRLHARIYGHEIGLVSSVTSSVTLTPTTWTWVAVRWDGDIAALSVQVGSNISEGTPPSGDSSSTPMGIKRGTIQLAKYILQGSHTSFYGRLCCLALFDSIVDVNSVEAELEALAHPTSWQSKAPVVKPGCPVGVAYSTALLYLWPLSNSSFGYDVINTLPPTAPANYQCTRPSQGTSVTNQTLTYRDGSQLSYFHTTIMHEIFDEEMLNLQIFLKPEDPVEGVVWEYRVAPGQSGVGFQRMTLTLVAGVPTVTVFDEFGECGRVVNREVLSSSAWTLVYLVISKGPSKLLIFTVTENAIGPSASGVLTCPLAIKTPPSTGVMTVGSLSDVTLKTGARDVSYHGSMACFAIYKEFIDRFLAFSNLKTQCTNLDDLQLNEDISECHVPPAVREQKFVRSASDKSPHLQNPLLCVTVTSLVGCSDRCRGQVNCRAFTFRPAQTECCLYDYVTEAGLQQEAGCSYYTVARV